MSIMYLRFVTPGAITRAGIRPGLFRAASDLCGDLWPSPLARAIDHELCWFGKYLPVPSGSHPFAVRARRVWHKDGICWFRPEPAAREAIAHAHVLAVLLEDGGIPVERITARHPGTILYRDAMQVVAKPH
ncbi:hypothetical protein [Novosphingobium beihaiensis]|uniref:Uncharacterized protein n=1 Tax=Novosphingobium beihaiensis TaxID=2930389 RepID=A0ABT0BUG9_9SPHN|nr:hypothetical protein [Novosphingobium beihaiensis]MCJ2188706.1 hypothetical protein [Novosphingobium beihaiensis]